jgi:hypothetical protein
VPLPASFIHKSQLDQLSGHFFGPDGHMGLIPANPLLSGIFPAGASLETPDLFSQEPLTVSSVIAEQYMGRDQEATEFLSGGEQFVSVPKVEVHMSHWEERPMDSDPLLGDVVLPMQYSHRFRRLPFPTYIALNDDVRVLADGVRINRIGIGFSFDVISIETYHDFDDEAPNFRGTYDLSPDDITLLLKERLSFMT